MTEKDQARLLETRDAVIEIKAQLPALDKRVGNLERNQRWGVLAILGLGLSWVKGIFG